MRGPYRSQRSVRTSPGVRSSAPVRCRAEDPEAVPWPPSDLLRPTSVELQHEVTVPAVETDRGEVPLGGLHAARCNDGADARGCERPVGSEYELARGEVAEPGKDVVEVDLCGARRCPVGQ